MARKAKLGSGARFKAMVKKVGSPALAAYIGRRAHGAKTMSRIAAAGRRRHGNHVGRARRRA